MEHDFEKNDFQKSSPPFKTENINIKKTSPILPPQ